MVFYCSSDEMENLFLTASPALNVGEFSEFDVLWRSMHKMDQPKFGIKYRSICLLLASRTLPNCMYRFFLPFKLSVTN